MDIKTNKGNPLVLCDGYLMRKAKQSADGLRQFWRCQLEKSGCQGRAVSAYGSVVLKDTNSHNIHGASPAEVQKRKALTDVKKMANAQIGVPAQAIVASVKANLSVDAIQSFPQDVNVKRRINNARKPLRGADVNKPLRKMKLSEEYKTTATGGRFLLVDSRSVQPREPVFLIFASDRGLDFLRLHRNWSIDGTFFCSPEHFVQMFTINVFKEESTLPAVFLLLRDKSEETYSRAFQALFSQLAGVSPLTIMSDFERAPINVLTNLFPRVNVNFCLFHFGQSLFRNLSKRGLKILYDIPGIKSLLRSFNALAFLPTNEVETGYEELLVEVSAQITSQTIPRENVAKLQEFLRYIEYTYIRRIDENGEEMDPLFLKESWNCYESVLNKLPRTNNAMEGWHKEFNRKFSKRNTKLSHFIVRLKEEEHTTWQLALRHEANPADPVRNPRSTKVVNSERQIFKLVSDYSNVEPQNRRRLPYLRSLQFHMSKFYIEEPSDDLVEEVLPEEERESDQSDSILEEMDEYDDTN